MNERQRAILRILKKNFVYASVFGLSLLFFLYKGFIYLIIGSYIPIVLISTIVILIILSSRKSEKSFKRIISIWVTLLVVWSSVRLLFSLINQFLKPIPESHVSEQLGISGLILSLLFLSGAIYLWIYKKRIFEN